MSFIFTAYILPSILCFLFIAKCNRIFKSGVVPIPMFICFVPIINIVFMLSAAYDIVAYKLKFNKLYEKVNDWYKGENL